MSGKNIDLILAKAPRGKWLDLTALTRIIGRNPCQNGVTPGSGKSLARQAADALVRNGKALKNTVGYKRKVIYWIKKDA